MPQSAGATHRWITESNSAGAPTAPGGCCPMFHNNYYGNTFNSPPMINPVSQQCLLSPQAAASTQLPPPAPATAPAPAPAHVNVLPTNITRLQQHHHHYINYPQVPFNLSATNGQMNYNLSGVNGVNGVNNSVPLRGTGQPTSNPPPTLSQPQHQPPQTQNHSHHQMPPTSHAVHKAPTMILHEQTTYNNTSMFNQDLPSLHHLFPDRHQSNCMAFAAALASAASYPHQPQPQPQQHPHHPQPQAQSHHQQQQHRPQQIQQPPQQQHLYQNHHQPFQPILNAQTQHHQIGICQPMPASQPNRNLQQFKQTPTSQMSNNHSKHNNHVNNIVEPPLSAAAIDTAVKALDQVHLELCQLGKSLEKDLEKLSDELDLIRRGTPNYSVIEANI